MQEGVEEICSWIQQEAAEECEKIRQQAEERVQEILKKAHAEARKQKAVIMRSAKMEIQKIQTSAQASVDLEVHKREMVFRESLEEHIWNALLETAGKIPSRTDYAKILSALIREGAELLGGGDLVIEGSSPALKVLTGSHLDALTDLLGKEGVSAQFATRESVWKDPGVVVVRSDGKTQVDNRFQTRLNASRETIRSAIYHALEKESSTETAE